MMTELPDFLPEMLDLDGVWEDVLALLYAVFKRDFIDKQPCYNGFKVCIDRSRSYEDKEATFWHLITKYEDNYGRIPDYDRARRLPWNKPVIENHNSKEVKEWSYVEGTGKVRHYLWLVNYDFCVILELKSSKQYCILVTAYYVQPTYRKKLQRKYENRMK